MRLVAELPLNSIRCEITGFATLYWVLQAAEHLGTHPEMLLESIKRR
jgi:hypothetical protein